MTQLLLVVTRVGKGEPTAIVSAYDAPTVGRSFLRGSLGHSLAMNEHTMGGPTMAGHFACEGWEDVSEHLREEGRLYHFQPWIDGAMDRVTFPDAMASPSVTRPQ
jgi:hypothetical protein